TPSVVETTSYQAPTTTAPVIVEPTKDVCPNGDWTGDRYDRRCGTPPQTTTPKPTTVVTTQTPTTTAPSPPTSPPTPDYCPGEGGDKSGDPYDGTCHRRVPGLPTTPPVSLSPTSTAG
ncbi:hypothetical protein, partial [Tessaracoccus sp. SD287]|uniref:hypothetical protein n=1 Tax=Tessaracoccus sp. SD287 TaxID=2782008 RepID=UPI001A958D9E